MDKNMISSLIAKIANQIFGYIDGLFYALVAFVVIDYITGVCVAMHNKRLSSKIGARGISKKVSIFALVSLSHIIDLYILDSKDILRTVTTAFYISNEALSILENAGEIGLPLPQKLQSFLTYFQDYNRNNVHK